MFDAKSRLSELIDGDEVVLITKHGKPVATPTPIRAGTIAAAEPIRSAPRILATSEAVAEISEPAAERMPVIDASVAIDS